MYITVFTPSYNRADKLIRLYESLKRQSNKNFEWLIIDDGSSDNTKEVVEKFIEENILNIRYVYQKNSGKQSAYNLAINFAKSDIFICVDSDDWLVDSALEKLLLTFKNKVVSCNLCAGIIFLDVDFNQKVIGSNLPTNIEYSTLYDLYNNENVTGDKGLAFLTHILKKYEFPLQINEIFITESVLYNRICKDYKLYVFNEILEVRDYQPDGLSSMYKNLLQNNPNGTCLYFNEMNFLEDRTWGKIKNNARFIQYKILAKKINIKFIYKEIIFKKYFSLSLILGFSLYIKENCLKL